MVPSPVTATTCLCSMTVLSMIPGEEKHDYLRFAALCYLSFEPRKERRMKEKKKKQRTFDQGVLISGRRAGEHSQFGPDLVDAFLFDLEKRRRIISSSGWKPLPQFRNLGASLSSHFSFFVAYPPVELFALQADEVVAGLQDAALGGDGPGRVDVVACHHPHRDACTLALPDGIWDL